MLINVTIEQVKGLIQFSRDIKKHDLIVSIESTKILSLNWKWSHCFLEDVKFKGKDIWIKIILMHLKLLQNMLRSHLELIIFCVLLIIQFFH